jgi:hypothetical protein
MSLAVRGQRKDDYIPCTMTTNNAGWERGWFYLRNDEPGLPPYTGLVLRERPASWHHGVSPSQHQARLDSLLTALRNLAGRGLTAEVILAHLHHRQIVPLMERPLRIFEMTEEADPVVLARSRSLQSPLLREYARQSTTGVARAAEAPVRVSEASARAAEAPARAVERAGGAAAVAQAAPATSAGTSRKRKRAFSSSR